MVQTTGICRNFAAEKNYSATEFNYSAAFSLPFATNFRHNSPLYDQKERARYTRTGLFLQEGYAFMEGRLNFGASSGFYSIFSRKNQLLPPVLLPPVCARLEVLTVIVTSPYCFPLTLRPAEDAFTVLTRWTPLISNFVPTGKVTLRG